MAEVNINEAIERVHSERLRERTEGLADLKHILSQNRRSARLEALNDKGYHKIYEALFRVATNEKSVYVRSSKVSVKSQSASRLSSCASVLRLAVEVGVRKLKPKTVKALGDHITQTLPTANEGYCEPLSLDYAKALRSVLDYQPHVEHYSKAQWTSLVDFCTEGIDLLEDEAASTSSNPSNGLGSSSMFSNTGTPNVPSTRSRSTPRRLDSNGASKLHPKSVSEELVLCLQRLTLAPNAPQFDRSQAIFDTLLRFLHPTATISRSHQAAFSTINAVLSRARTQHITLTQQFIESLVPLISVLWSTKSSSLKDEMVVTLVYGKEHLLHLMRNDDSHDFRRKVEGLLETLQSDYSKRLERDQLQLDDLSLTISNADSEGSPLCLNAFSVRSGSLRPEQNWMVLHINAFLICLLDHSTALEDTSDNTDLNRPSKRRRTSQRFSDLLRLAKFADTTGRLCALHTIPFFLQEVRLDEAELRDLLGHLVEGVSEENSTVASWALLGLTR
ncbi:MAG: hypothetical protein M1819_000369 [Sarea resinae]|nr:MAG: hypothetical protein M1819_000369 [Sarea resinae]